MGERTKIEWCDHTFNPWIGCTKVHEGCRSCYAEADQDHRRHRVTWGPTGTRSMTGVETWKKPLQWNRQAAADGVLRRVFCASLADVFEDWTGPMCDYQGRHLVHTTLGFHPEECEELEFHNRVTMADARERLFKEVIDATPHLQWIVVTKRPQNIRRFWPSGRAESSHRRENVWLVTSVSDQESADKQIPDLIRVKDVCQGIGISAEPLLGPIDLTAYMDDLQWVIVGGESGPNARPMHPAWPLSLRDQCLQATIPFFFKQWGEWLSVRVESRNGIVEFVPYLPVTMQKNIVARRADPPGWRSKDEEESLQSFHSTSAIACRLGKRHSGRWLEDREWNEFPPCSIAGEQ